MEYKYHCQHQTESFARSILPVPDDYPLSEGLAPGFRPRFARLCELARRVYLDMAQSPEGYGLLLVDIDSNDHNLARDGYRTIHRLVDTLYRLFACGEVSAHRLTVDAQKFGKAIRSGERGAAGPVAKYELILRRLADFGFAISDFGGNPFGRDVESFTVAFPNDPEVIDTIQTYFDCWNRLKADPPKLEHSTDDLRHRFYRFDYKITSDLPAIPIRQWVIDDGVFFDFSPEVRAFSLAFYDYSLRYKGVRFDGEYFVKSRRIARVTQVGYTALGDPNICLSLKLPDPDGYADYIARLPESLKSPFSRDYCNHCNFQGATEEYCKFRLRWTFEGKTHLGCAHQCFFFNDFDLALVPDYWRLLELEYGLKLNAKEGAKP